MGEDAGTSFGGTERAGSRWAALGWTLLGPILIVLLAISVTRCPSHLTLSSGWVDWRYPAVIAILAILLIWVMPIAIKHVIVNLRPRDSGWSEGIPSTLRSVASRPEQILPELGHLTERLEIWTARASSHQSDYLTLGRQLIVLSQLAVLLLSLQLVLSHEGHPSCGFLLIGG